MTDVMIQILYIFMRSVHAQERRNLKQNIRKLMGMSFEGTKEKRVIFTIDDLQKFGLHSDEVRDLIIKVPGNNMLCQHLMEGDSLMFFSHQILQEILASLYIANMDLATFKSFITEEIHDDHWSVVLRFLCGNIFNQDIKTEFLKDLTTVIDRKEKEALLRENLKAKISQCTEAYQKLELFGALYEANDAELIRSHVQKINFENESFTAAGMYAMSSVMRRCDHLEQFRLVKCGLNAELMKCLELNLKGSGLKVSELDISGNQMNKQAFKSLGSALASIDGKEMGLKLQMCGLTKDKTDALGRNSGFKIHTLDVRNNSNITFDLFLAIAKVATQSEVENLLTDPCEELHLTTEQLMELSKWKTCGKIRTLDVRNNSEITFDLFLAIAKVATQSEVKNLLTDPCEELHATTEQLMELSKWKTCGKLDKLDVSGNKNLGTAGWGEVGKVVLQCQVKAFEARNCNLTAEGMEAFKENTGNAKLDKLDVSGNKNLGTAGWGEVGKVVLQCQVKAFEARNCNLTAEGMEAFKENTGNAKLDKLVVSGNRNLGTAGFAEVGKVVTQCHVKEFEARNCNLRAEGMKAFRENTLNAKLDKLVVSGNENLGSAGFAEVGKVVTQCHVKEFEARNCNLRAKGMKAFRENTLNAKIHTLDVRNNSKITFDLFLAIAKVATQSEVKNLLTDPCGELHPTTEQLIELSKWKTCGKLNKLDVSGNKNLGTAGWGEVGKVVLQCQVKTFEAWNCNLTAEGMEAFKENTGNAKLDKLDVSGNKNLGTAGWGEVGKIVLQCQVEALVARDCNLTAEGMQAFKENTGNAKIHTLDVRNNSKITFDLFLAIAKVATQSEVKNLLTDPCEELHPTTEQLMELSIWKTCGKIHTLDVRNNSKITFRLFLAIAKVATQSEVKNLLTNPCEELHLTTEQLMELSKWKTCGKIHTLDVRNNSKITFDLFLAIAKVATSSKVENLLTNPCEELHLITEQLMELSKWKTCGKLDKLGVSGNKNLGTAGWGEVGKVVLQCQVKAFKARNCNLTAEGMEAFKENTGNAKLNKLDVSGNKNLGITGFGEVGKVVTRCQVKALVARDCNLTAEGMKAFKENTLNAKLDKLDVSGNWFLGTAGFGEVGLVVSQCQVKTLEARNCNLTAEGMKAFKENTRNAKIIFLDLSGNNVTKFGLEWLTTMSEIVHQCQVKTLKMRNCLFTRDQLIRFKELIADTEVEFIDAL
uniref:uncharacterized protein LOC120331725 n=1 Tax=Styela clava TaxID=7725 RepID=UPI0019395649|nr:uncharacterized protein LOC120331725 [Styela clava]